jgi:hypothetical protein
VEGDAAVAGTAPGPKLLGLHWALWRADCGGPPFVGWVVQEEFEGV